MVSVPLIGCKPPFDPDKYDKIFSDLFLIGKENVLDRNSAYHKKEKNNYKKGERNESINS